MFTMRDLKQRIFHPILLISLVVASNLTSIVTTVCISGGKMSLTLSDGKQVPVSRSFRTIICDAGILDGIPQMT